MSDYSPEFREWWKCHRDAGFCEDRFGKSHWGIFPSLAWKHDCYRAEFSIVANEKYDRAQEYTAEEIDQWFKDQRDKEAFTKQYGFTFNCEDNQRIALKMIKERSLAMRVQGMLNGDKSMQYKIDEAYAPEPGQSQEETDLLSRRREDDDEEPLI